MFSGQNKIVGEHLPYLFFPTGELVPIWTGPHCLTSGFSLVPHKAPSGRRKHMVNTLTVINRNAVKISFGNGNGSRGVSKRKRVP